MQLNHLYKGALAALATIILTTTSAGATKLPVNVHLYLNTQYSDSYGLVKECKDKRGWHGCKGDVGHFVLNEDPSGNTANDNLTFEPAAGESLIGGGYAYGDTKNKHMYVSRVWKGTPLPMQRIIDGRTLYLKTVNVSANR